ncbi:sensor histidine kinase [Pseudonocardia endophytica]|uniref:sensor histidine kinase n=1 Tax=Pseudonocardia endophytica TaxID=401976 RepID=UPI0010527DB3|nr:histidine kinase [Pseudonocardia endophytica]
MVRPTARSGVGGALATAMERAGLAPRLARGILVAVMTCIGIVAVIKVVETRLSVLQTVLCLVYLAAVVALQLRYFAWQDEGAGPSRRATLIALAVQGLLAYLPLLQFGRAWVGMPGLFAGSVLLALPAVPAWSLFAVVVVSIAVVQFDMSGSWDDVLYTGISTVLTGLVVYGLCKLATLVGMLSRARAEFARLAIEAERDRVARDLHDILGYQLSAIALKTELAQRLIDARPERARTELDESLGISRDALSEVRGLARGITALSLSNEIRSTHSTLAAAGIDLEVTQDGDLGSVPDDVRTALAVVLREAVTNLLRHSAASSCSLRLTYGPGPVELVMDNDRTDARGPDGEPGRVGGLGNLRQRMADVGGSFEAGPRDDGTFRLRASVP